MRPLPWEILPVDGRIGKAPTSLVSATPIIGIFVAVVGAAMLAGRWQNSIPQQEYLRRFKEIDSPYYNHTRDNVMTEDPAPAPKP